MAEFLKDLCRKIAWSKLGCISYVGKDGHAVNLRHLVCNSQDGQWKLSEENLADEVSAVQSEHQIVHLCWNHTGNDLAIINIYGQISIFTIIIALNRLTVSRRHLIDPEDHLGAVVGYMWLNTEREVFARAFSISSMLTWQFPLYRPTVKQNGQWKFAVSQHKLMGPHNPSTNKSALVAVTRGGGIRILLQGQDMRWQDAKAEIDGISTSAELLTHAALCADKGKCSWVVTVWYLPSTDSTMLLATFSARKRLRFYRVGIDFQQMLFNTQHLTTIDYCAPLDQPVNSLPLSYSAAFQLSHLHLLPPGPETGQEHKAPLILAVFSQVPDHTQDLTAREELCSILARWQFCSRKPRLHSSFEQLMPKKTNSIFPGDLPVSL